MCFTVGLLAISAVGTVGGLVEGGITASAAQSAANTAQHAASITEGEQQTVFGEQQGYAAQLQALMSDPSSVTSLPGYQFQLDQGTQAVQRQMAAGGMNMSSNEGIALEQYGQGYATNFYSTYEQQLAQLAGLTSASSPAQYAGAAGSQTSAATGASQNSFGQIGSLSGALAYLAMNGGGIFGGGNPNSPNATSVEPSSYPGMTSVDGNYLINNPGFVAPGAMSDPYTSP